jgi:hypothetical protein
MKMIGRYGQDFLLRLLPLLDSFPDHMAPVLEGGYGGVTEDGEKCCSEHVKFREALGVLHLHPECIRQKSQRTAQA